MTDPCPVCGVPDGAPHLAAMGDPYRDADGHLVADELHSHPETILGLPDDLARVLRNPSIIVPQDASVFELIARWANAPSNTASAD